jgi:hypothetical protein
MTYIKNPKTNGSGILCCIPQKNRCTINCEDCFFQSGRSYLDPLDKNLPNIPDKNTADGFIIRINDGNDSNNEIDTVIKETEKFKMKFYNTSIPRFEKFKDPVVLTVNPSGRTDTSPFLLEKKPINLMFVRIRTNMWNLENVVDKAVEHYSKLEVPIVLTFLAYFNKAVPEQYKENYIFRKRTMNSYFAITTAAWEKVMSRYKYNRWVYSCGKVEGEKGITGCRFCGNCHREFFVTLERIKK